MEDISIMPLPVVKQYRISLEDKCKGRMHLTKHLDALIYFYPQGFEGKSTPNYCASDVQLQILSDSFKYDNEKIEFVWKCGDQKKSQICSIREYIEPDADKALGFHTLFSIKDIEKADRLIKVTCTIKAPPPPPPPTKSENQETTNSTAATNTKSIKNRKRKFVEKMTKKNATSHNRNEKKKLVQSKLNFSCVKKRKINNGANNKPKKWNLRDDWKLSSSKLSEAIEVFSNRLRMDTTFDLLPTIDCFATDKNYQVTCKHYITENDNFFSVKYDAPEFWKDEVAWCFPPHNRKTITDCMDAFRPRKMRGYVCVSLYRNSKYPQQKESWWANAKRLAVKYINLQGINENDNERYKSNGRCPFDFVIFYFDYQNQIKYGKQRN